MSRRLQKQRSITRLTRPALELSTQVMKVRWVKDWKPMRFRYGSSTSDESIGLVELMCTLKGKTVYLRLHVVPGTVPLLISKPILKELGGILNFSEDTLELTKLDVKVPMLTGPSGHYQLDLLGLGALSSAEVDFGNTMFAVGEAERTVSVFL